MKITRLRIADCGLKICRGIIQIVAGSQNLFLIQSTLKNPQSAIRNPQSGAALIALLAAMSVMAIVLLAAAPSYYQQLQREKELESIRRGEEVATAIRAFIYYEKRLPKSMEELLEGVDVPGRTKKLMVLRASAAKDPLSSTGEWKLVQSNDENLKNFTRKLFIYNNNNPLTNPGPNEVRQLLDPFTTKTIVNNLDIETTEESEPPGGEDTSGDSDVPFVGVVSRRQTKSVLAYYGIERHDWWVFTPLYRGESGFGGGFNNTPPRQQRQR